MGREGTLSQRRDTFLVSLLYILTTQHSPRLCELSLTWEDAQLLGMNGYQVKFNFGGLGSTTANTTNSETGVPKLEKVKLSIYRC